MGRISVVIATIFYVLAFSFFPNSSFAQRSFGVLWDVPDNREEAVRQLNHFEELKIRYIEVDELVNDFIWREINQRNFNVFVQIPVTFPVIETFQEADSSLVQTFQLFLNRYSDKQIEAIGVFEFGQSNNQRFAEAVQPFTQQIDTALSLPIYYKEWNLAPNTLDNLFNFNITRLEVTPAFQSLPDSTFLVSNAFLYAPTANLKNRVAPLKWFIEKASINPDALLFFESKWLLNFTQEYKSTGRVLAEFATSRDAVFPLPREATPTDDGHSIIILILFVLWGMVALTYSFTPTYRHSLFRFFLNHQFFIEDVIQRHIRSIVPSLVLLCQHAVLGGIFLYCLANTYLSSIGVEVFYFYFPVLKLFGNSGHLSFFFLGTLITLLFQTISLLWLYLANWRIGYLSQISILYSWPFHINLVIATIIVTLMISSSSPILLAGSYILFIVVVLLDFPITAYDTGQNMKGNRWLYATGTLGLYLLLLATSVLLVLTDDRLLNILELSVTIS